MNTLGRVVRAIMQSFAHAARFIRRAAVLLVIVALLLFNVATVVFEPLARLASSAIVSVANLVGQSVTTVYARKQTIKAQNRALVARQQQMRIERRRLAVDRGRAVAAQRRAEQSRAATLLLMQQRQRIIRRNVIPGLQAMTSTFGTMAARATATAPSRAVPLAGVAVTAAVLAADLRALCRMHGTINHITRDLDGDVVANSRPWFCTGDAGEIALNDPESLCLLLQEEGQLEGLDCALIPFEWREDCEPFAELAHERLGLNCDELVSRAPPDPDFIPDSDTERRPAITAPPMPD
ncbi:MAG: hypothetical protein JJT95_12245 [Pararhodobacter sp.]|nr:hypothetical protein [Pararhodobacter sp.]